MNEVRTIPLNAESFSEAPSNKEGGAWHFEGEWTARPDCIEHTGVDGEYDDYLFLKFSAAEVGIVMSSPASTIIHVKLDGKRYRDVEISEQKSYNLLKNDRAIEGELKIFVKDKGVRAYAFTFGGCVEG